MADSNDSILLVVMLDAFRWDYIQRTPALERFATTAEVARLREPFGFNTGLACFGGVNAISKLARHLFVFAPQHSPFRFLRLLEPEFRAGSKARRELESMVAPKLTSFVRAYASTLDVPLSLLPFFDFAEQFAPWDRQAGYRSIFHEMDERGMRWASLGWPYQTAGNPGDAGICDQALRLLENRPRMLFVHFQEADGAGHCFGPGSPEVTAVCQKTSEHLDVLMNACRAAYSLVDVLLFADHGMVTTQSSIDIWALLNQSRRRLGEEYVCFLDSTMARFWFLRNGVRAEIEELLSGVRGGRVIREDEERRLGIEALPRENAELYFLADPGVTISPCFFDMSGGRPKGMHGYDPDCKDNQGVFLFASNRSEPLGVGEVVDATDIYDICRQRIWGGIQPCSSPPKQQSERAFCHTSDPDAVAKVNSDLAQIVSAIRARCPATAVLLTGSFGRGEGAVWKDPDRGWLAVNDYDIVIVDGSAPHDWIPEAERELAATLGTDGVDLAVWNEIPIPDPAAVPLFFYDFRYGTRTLLGESKYLDAMPQFSPACIPVREGLQLLLNRLAGLHLGLARGECEESPSSLRYLQNQITKAGAAIADSFLIAWGDYTSRVTDKITRFCESYRAARVSPDLAEIALSALRRKLEPDYHPGVSLRSELEAISTAMQSAICASASSALGCDLSNAAGLCRDLPLYAPVNGARIEADNDFCRRRLRKGGFTVRRLQPGFSIRNAILASLLRLLVDEDHGPAAVETLGILTDGLPGWDASAGQSQYRRAAIQFWELCCHSH